MPLATLKEGPHRGPSSLLELDLGAGFFELRLDLIGLFLRRAFLDRVRRAIDQVLGFLQAQARDRADDLDHLDLLVAGAGKNDVEGGLLLLCRRAVAAGSRGTRCRHRDRSGRAHAPLLLELVLELHEIEDGHAPELLDELVGISLRHLAPPLVLLGLRLPVRVPRLRLLPGSLPQLRPPLPAALPLQLAALPPRPARRRSRPAPRAA